MIYFCFREAKFSGARLRGPIVRRLNSLSAAPLNFKPDGLLRVKLQTAVPSLPNRAQ
jgi:hypothetical protein